MDPTAYVRLSPRELECLRLVADGLQSKEIAARLSTPERPLKAGTVDGYIKSAVQTLGAQDRRAAARMVAAEEGKDPRWLGGQPAGVDQPAPPPAEPSPATGRGRTSFPWPWRRPGEVDNHLGIGTRLLWIPLLAIGIAAGFGSLASGLRVAADLFGWSPLLMHSAKSDDHDPSCIRPDERPQRRGAARSCAPVRAAAR